jgi:hypothetical protein
MSILTIPPFDNVPVLAQPARNMCPPSRKTFVGKKICLEFTSDNPALCEILGAGHGNETLPTMRDNVQRTRVADSS